jgi:uncharacterized MnhB-related membrane protein
MILKYIMHVLLIIVAIMTIKERNYLRMIIYFSVFSLVISALYFLNAAPDVAIAEIAIGSALIPLIFLLTVSKQRVFIVTGDVMNQCFIDDTGNCKSILQEFCDFYNLDLRIMTNVDEEDLQLTGVFRKVNIDLYVEKRENMDAFYLVGKESSILMNKLEKMVEPYPNLQVILVPDIDMGD